MSIVFRKYSVIGVTRSFPIISGFFTRKKTSLGMNIPVLEVMGIPSILEAISAGIAAGGCQRGYLHCLRIHVLITNGFAVDEAIAV